MLFKSIGVAAATHSSANSEDFKPVTLRLSENEVQLYDAIGKAMGLNRQDFLAHLIRSSFKAALSEFVIGYTSSAPSISVEELIHSYADSDEVKARVSSLLRSINSELMDEEEKSVQEFFRNGGDDAPYYEYATPRKGIFAEKKSSAKPLFGSEEDSKDD